MPVARADSPSTPLAEVREKPLPSGFSPAGCWNYFRQLSVLGLFGFLGLSSSLVCTVILKFSADKIPASAGLGLMRGLFVNWLKFSIGIGVFDIQFPDAHKLANLRGTIVAPNHPSMVDAVLLLTAVPHAVCIMRAGLQQNPLLGGTARMARFITNDRGPALIREGIEKLGQGKNLLIFPEGTRTRDDAVNSFKEGFALIAVKAAAPIQTILIEREELYLAKGVSLFAQARLPIRLRIHLGELIRPAPYESAHELSNRLETYFRTRLVNTGEAIRLSAAQP